MAMIVAACVNAPSNDKREPGRRTVPPPELKLIDSASAKGWFWLEFKTQPSE